jgi:uncharacterized membrane-anchored protein YhcB (DUF1043 family)
MKKLMDSFLFWCWFIIAISLTASIIIGILLNRARSLGKSDPQEVE